MIDPLLVQIAERHRARAGKDKIPPPASILEWATRYRRPDGQPFSLDKFEPLREIYSDTHKRIVIIKPAQRGVSEYAICYACYALELGADQWISDGSKSGLNVGYIFPVKEALNDFSKERISALQTESTHLALLFNDTTQDQFDSLGFKQIGKSYFYLRGGNSTSHLISFPADVMILDEFDQMPRSAVALARRRLNASDVKRELVISTPTYPGRGIHAEYLNSDQRVYQTKCATCDEWVSFDFFRDVMCDGEPYVEGWRYWSQEHVETSEVTLHCPKCKSAIDDPNRLRQGRWMPQRPEVTRTHGYWVPWWPFRFVELKMLALSAVSPETEEVIELYRSDLGIPYGSGGGAVTSDMLMQCSALASNGTPSGPGVWRDTTLGADVGTRIHVRISSTGPDGNRWVRHMGIVSHWMGPDDSLESLMREYNVRMAVVDAEPELRDSMDFCNQHRGRAKRAFYPPNDTALRGNLYHEKKDLPNLNINRTMAMDDLYGDISRAAEVWPAQFAMDPEIIAHMEAPTRVTITDEKGERKHSWVHTTPDHFFHASVYDSLARKILPKGVEFKPAIGGERTETVDYNRFAAAISIGAKSRSARHERSLNLDPRRVR